MRTYYIDESGNTGDAVRTGEKFDFGAQPLFTLACIGIDDPASLKGELARLKTLHAVQGVELKSSSIRNKPGFVRDLIAYLKRQCCPLFIEVVDKKFFICAHVVSTLLMPPVMCRSKPVPALVKCAVDRCHYRKQNVFSVWEVAPQ